MTKSKDRAEARQSNISTLNKWKSSCQTSLLSKKKKSYQTSLKKNRKTHLEKKKKNFQGKPGTPGTEESNAWPKSATANTKQLFLVDVCRKIWFEFFIFIFWIFMIFCSVLLRERERFASERFGSQRKYFLFFLFFITFLSILIFGYNLIIPTLRPSFLIVYPLTSSPLFID